jgi:AraC-like DNA-binding protein
MQIQDWERLAREANFQPQVMAALCPISLRQLERFFKRDLKKTPSRWVRDLRCRLALKLISAGWSSKAVAAELHYWDESHFCHEFKRVYGVPPQNFAPVYGNNRRSSLQSNVGLLPGCRAFNNQQA